MNQQSSPTPHDPEEERDEDKRAVDSAPLPDLSLTPDPVPPPAVAESTHQQDSPQEVHKDTPPERVPSEPDAAPKAELAPAPLQHVPDTTAAATTNTSIDPSTHPANQPLPEGELPDPSIIYPAHLSPEQPPQEDLQTQLERNSLGSDLRRHWKQILTGSIETIPDHIRRKVDTAQGNLSPAEREQQLLRSINQSWAADHLPHGREHIQKNWSEIREELSEGYFVASDEHELFLAISEQERKYENEDLGKEIYSSGFQQGLLASDPLAWQEKINKQKEKLNASQHDIIDRYAQAALEKGAQLRAKLLPIAETLSEGIEMMVSAERRIYSPEQIVDSSGSARRAGSQLRKLSQEERQLVYHLCLEERRKKQGAYAPDDDRVAQRMLRSAKRGATNVGFDLGLGALHLGSGALHSAGALLDESLGTDLQATAQDVDLRARVANEIRDLAQQQAAPLYIPEDSSLSEQFLIDMAGVVPVATMGFGGLPAWGALLISGAGTSVSDARERNPEGDLALQNMAGLLGAAVQESISFGFTRVGGKLFEQSMKQFIQARGRGMRAYSLASLHTGGAVSTQTIKMVLESQMGQGADFAAHELSSLIDQTNSNIDWKTYGNNLTDIEHNLRESAMTLPYLLIGAGRAQLHHFEQAHDLKNNALIMRSWGVSEKDIEALAAEDNLQRANEKLQQALRQSPHWGGVPFIKEAIQSLKLLNVDYFSGFKEEELVREFLQIPSEIDDLPHTKAAIEPIQSDEQFNALNKKHGTGSLKVHKNRLSKVLEVWDYLWRRSNLDRFLPRNKKDISHSERMHIINAALDRRHERNLRDYKSKDPLVPLGLLRGFYTHKAEQKRRAMIKDRAAELHDISYIYLLTTSSPDLLIRNDDNTKTAITKREMKRQRFLDRIATQVIERVHGRTREESAQSIRHEIGEIYRHFRTTPFTASWIKPLSRKHFREMHKYALFNRKQRKQSRLPREFFQASDLVIGAEQAIEFFYEMIPQMDDFHRLLARDQSPTQAYGTILMRELGLTGKEFRKTYIEKVNKVKSKSDIESERKKHEQQFDLYQRFTDHRLEQIEGLGGENYWRARLPDGSPTRWHASREHAITDLIMSTHTIFRPMKEKVLEKQQELTMEDQYKVEDYLNESREEYSNFDTIAATAFQDLYNYHVKSAATGFRGLQFSLFKQKVALREARHLLDFSPVDKSQHLIKDFKIHEYATTTPYALTRTRAHAYWKNLLSSQFHLRDTFLQEFEDLGLITADERRKALVRDPSPVPMNPGLARVSISAPIRTSIYDRVLENVSKIFARISTDYLFANIDSHPLPESLKTWLKLVPLSPPEPDVPKKQHIRLGYRRRNLLRWSNRQTATHLQKKVDHMQELRDKKERIEQSPLMPYILSSQGLNKSENAERAWSHFYGGYHIAHNQNGELWNFQMTPAQSWKASLPKRKAWLYSKLIENYGFLEDREQLYGTRQRFAKSLQTLEDVLNEYPELHELSLAPNSKDRFIRVELEDPSEKTRLFEDPALLPIGWKLPTKSTEGYRYRGEISSPTHLLKDERVLPSMLLLHDLRLLNAESAIYNDQGIWMQGKRLGLNGEKLPGMGENWKAQRVLSSLFPLIEEINTRFEPTEGDLRNYVETSFTPLNDTLDTSALEHATLYRDDYYPSHTLRLMPGELDHHDPTRRSPYVAHVRSGVYFLRRAQIPDPAGVDGHYESLNEYKYIDPMPHTEKTQSEASMTTSHHLIYRLFDEMESESFENSILQGTADVQDLLISLYEDTGLSLDLSKRGIDELTPPQITLLMICYNLAHIQYGKQGEQAYANISQLLSHVRSKERGVERIALSIYDMLERQNKASRRLYQRAIKDGNIKERKYREPNKLKDIRDLKNKYRDRRHLFEL